MREIFEDAEKRNPLDATEAAQRAMRPDLRKRFFKEARVQEENGGFCVTLDGRAIRTPARKLLAVPTRALAQALADEWQAQLEVIDPAKMPLTRLANSIIDGVTDSCAAVADDILKYLASDLLFYRADGPARLVERQQQMWDPLLVWAREAFGAHFILAQGVVHVNQPEDSIAAAKKVMPSDPWRLGALHAITTLTGSALLALALGRNAISPERAWATAHVDEDFNAETWGRDDMAMMRHDARASEYEAAIRVLKDAG